MRQRRVRRFRGAGGANRALLREPVAMARTNTVLTLSMRHRAHASRATLPCPLQSAAPAQPAPAGAAAPAKATGDAAAPDSNSKRRRTPHGGHVKPSATPAVLRKRNDAFSKLAGKSAPVEVGTLAAGHQTTFVSQAPLPCTRGLRVQKDDDRKPAPAVPMWAVYGLLALLAVGALVQIVNTATTRKS